MTKGRSSAIRFGVRRSVGPDTLSAATTWPFSSNTGAATAQRPSSSSSVAAAKPSRRIVASSDWRRAGSTIVREVSGSSGPSSGMRAASCASSTLPLAEQWYGTLRPTHCVVPRKCLPSTWARCSTPLSPGTPRLIVSPVASASAPIGRSASSIRLRPTSPRPAKRSTTGPARKRPRIPCCSTRPLRSRAPRRRDAVLFGRPASAARSVSPRGASDSSTSARSWAPRSITAVPAAGWNSCSMPDILSIAARTVKPRPPHGAGAHSGGEPMFVNQMPRYEILSEEAMDTLDKGWRRIVSELGVEFMLPEAVEYFEKAGQRVEDNKVFLDPEFLLEQVAKAPREFDLLARNPEHTIHIGGNHMVFSSVYGPPFVREGDVRRDAKMADFENF